MEVSAKKCGSASEHEVWRGQLDGKRGKLGFGMWRRVSLVLATVTGAARGPSGHDLRRLLGLWVSELSFRREALSILDVAFVASECFPPRRRYAVEGASFDELLVTIFLVPLLRLSGPAAPSPLCDRRQSSRRRCLFVFGALEEKDCSARLDWDTGSMPPPEFRDSRAAVAGLLVYLPWVESFSYRFRHPQHVNFLEVETLTSLIRGPVDRGVGNRRVLCLVDSRVVLGSVCKCRSSSRRVNFRLGRVGGLLLAICGGYPLGHPPSDAPSRFYSVSKLRTALPLFSRELHITTPETLPEEPKLTDCSNHSSKAPETL